MKWILVFIALCFFVVPTIGDTVGDVSETDVLPALSPENTQALAVFNVLLEELDAVAGRNSLRNAEEDLTSRLMDLFLEEGSKTTFIRELMTAEAAFEEDYTPAYIIDSVTVLFYMAGNIDNDNSEFFARNIVYLKELIPEFENNSSVSPEYIDALKAAIEAWEKIYESALTPES